MAEENADDTVYTPEASPVHTARASFEPSRLLRDLPTSEVNSLRALGVLIELDGEPVERAQTSEVTEVEAPAATETGGEASGDVEASDGTATADPDADAKKASSTKKGGK